MIDTAVIFCGGRGTRLSEKTHKIPKPMLHVGGMPIVDHIIHHYVDCGVKNFILLAGYKREIIDKYFLSAADYVQVLDTGLEAMTGGRLLRAEKYLPEKFFLTYGDGICTVPLRSVLSYHEIGQFNVTLTAVHPPPRFGAITISTDGIVTEFSEKADHLNSWINGGFMCVNKNVLGYIKDDNSNFEKDVLPLLAKKGTVGAYRYSGYWHAIDTLRDLEKANEDWKSGAWL